LTSRQYWCYRSLLGARVYVGQTPNTNAPPTVKQHSAAIRMLFDWLAAGHVVEVNPQNAHGHLRSGSGLNTETFTR
jgi:hypothetical protein